MRVALIVIVALVGWCGCRQEEAIEAPALPSEPTAPAPPAPVAEAEPEDPLAGADEPAADGEFLRRVRPMVETICRCRDLACASKVMDQLRDFDPSEPELDEAHKLSLRMQKCVKRLRPSRSDTPSFDGDEEAGLVAPPAGEGGADLEAAPAAEVEPAPASYSQRMKAAVDAVCACEDLACAVEASRRTGHLEPTPEEMPVAVAEGRRLQDCMRRLAEEVQ